MPNTRKMPSEDLFIPFIPLLGRFNSESLTAPLLIGHVTLPKALSILSLTFLVS